MTIENDIRGLLRNFGLKVGTVGVIKFEIGFLDLVAGILNLSRSWHLFSTLGEVCR